MIKKGKIKCAILIENFLSNLDCYVKSIFISWEGVRKEDEGGRGRAMRKIPYSQILSDVVERCASTYHCIIAY